MPKVARAAGLVPNHGMLAAVAGIAVADTHVVADATGVAATFKVKSTLPLFPLPGLDSCRLDSLPAVNVCELVGLSWVSQLFRFSV